MLGPVDQDRQANKGEIVVVPGGQPPQGQEPEGDVIEQPGKLLRIASMIRELVEEVRQAGLDEGGRRRLREVYGKAVDTLKESLSPELEQELEELAEPLDTEASDAEIRVAQAQLLGWMEGLFHGIQAALWAQQMQARASIEELRRHALPAGHLRRPSGQEPQEGGPGTPGQYL
jgi:hypothetical protein